MKRLLDLYLALLLLALLWPLILLLAVAIWADVGEPVLFRQLRPGLHGKPFMLYKFRTMRGAAAGEPEGLTDEQRLTRFGRWLRGTSLDELPELWNVVRGDMSFVGPRPLLMRYLPLYTPDEMRRHDVRPGLTGWAQINGRNAISWEDKFRLDLWYVDHQSLALDCKIIFRTVISVLRREGISSGDSATMPEFTGSHIES